MRKIEMKTCRECNKLYRWESGGIIATPQDHMDFDLCEKCRAKFKIKNIGKLFGGKKQ